MGGAILGHRGAVGVQAENADVVATHYTRGRAFEYARKKVYEQLGCLVIRAAGSHSPYDLVAVSPSGVVFLIQCKRTGSMKTAQALLKKFERETTLWPGGAIIQVMEVWVVRDGLYSHSV